MHLSKYCDYALRSLMYLGARSGNITAADEIAKAFGVSTNHIVKSLQGLTKADHIQSISGRGGGYVFNRPPSSVRVGDVVKQLEPNLHMAECFSQEKNTCPLTPGCGLELALSHACQTFIDTLNQYTLEDLIASQTQKLLSLGEKP
ncbi:MAG: Rrf2 family transcriptional regulator [Candidatus Latescibacteria bacterium]|jgi:Rrf2 family transcriptional regulator, nitric oxide-sensitive transcriptional repressor|nr:Rrf2 family transcriptional regulator [Candidatus Latescibacterota bacterium]MBT4138791.1 Rrf2 family transcriptional regulator [Candidatus Latescibacterota bacterium]MBT5829985.1 Rrf2 family transcriptional regulator [Candidatus Latescibacterota bacterium]MBT7706810.1 Rrf2 family transcriptional regulator [archaeon]